MSGKTRSPTSMTAPLRDAQTVCQSCGACCATSRDWPRFTLEDDAALARIPEKFVDPSGARIACTGERCNALTGTVGTATSCLIYNVRPDVCRACEPGDEACTIARQTFGMPVIV